MKQKPTGTECRIYYDTDQPIAEGHYLISTGGSGYRVKTVRQSTRKPRRHNLVCIRCDPKEIPTGSTIHALHWYSRNPKRQAYR